MLGLVVSVYSVPSVAPCWVYSLGRFGLIDRPPDLFRRRGHFDLFDAERAQGVDDRIHDGRRAADRAEFADALRAKWIDLARRGLVGIRVEARQIVGARQAVVPQGAGNKLAGLRIVMRVFEQRLANRLRNAAVHLTGDDQRVDHPAHVVHRGVAHDLRDTGVGIDLDFADMATVRPGRAVHFLQRRNRDALFRLLRRELEQADAQVRARNLEAAVAILDVLPRRFQRVAGQFAAFFDGLFRSGQHRRAADVKRSAAHAADALGDVAVALHDDDPVGIDVQRFGKNLHVAGFNALTHRLHRGVNQHASVSLDMKIHGLFVYDAGPFQESRQRAPAQLAALARFVAPRRVALPGRLVETAAEHMRQVAAVELLAHRRLIGHLRGLDEIAPAQFRGIHFHFGGSLVHQALGQVDRFGPASAAVGTDQVGVGHHGRAAQMQRGNVVHAGDHLRTDGDYDYGARTAGMRTDVADDIDAQAENLAFGIEGELGMVDLVAAVIAAKKLLAAAPAPVHPELDLPRRPRPRHRFRISLGPHHATAADVTHDDAYILHRYLQAGLRQRLLQTGRILATGAQRNASASGVELGNAAARLHADRPQPLVVAGPPGN